MQVPQFSDAWKLEIDAMIGEFQTRQFRGHATGINNLATSNIHNQEMTAGTQERVMALPRRDVVRI